MKKVLLVLCILTIFLSSCDNNGVDNCDIIVNFTAQANVITDNGNILCSVSRAANNVSCISIYEPKSLQGLKFIRMDNKYSIEYNKLVYETGELYFPDSAFSREIINILDIIESGNELKHVDTYDNISVFKGECDVGDFEVMVNKNTKYIEKIVINPIKVSIIFSEQH